MKTIVTQFQLKKLQNNKLYKAIKICKNYLQSAKINIATSLQDSCNLKKT